MSAGHGYRSFGKVWTQSSAGNNLVGGSGPLPAATFQRRYQIDFI
jgi:hypothetical protein